MNVVISNYRPPNGRIPVVGDVLCCADGQRSIIEIVEVQNDGTYLLRLEKVDCFD